MKYHMTVNGVTFHDVRREEVLNVFNTFGIAIVFVRVSAGQNISGNVQLRQNCIEEMLEHLEKAVS